MAAVSAFDGLLRRMIELIDAKLSSGQREKLASAMPQIQWDFPDVEASLCLVACQERLRVAEPLEHPPFLVRMPRATLEDAAFGRRSLASAFLAGRIHVRGMNPLRLREFIMLVDPLLESYREASLELANGPSAAVS
jgi:hypothetical protein